MSCLNTSGMKLKPVLKPAGSTFLTMRMLAILIVTVLLCPSSLSSSQMGKFSSCLTDVEETAPQHKEYCSIHTPTHSYSTKQQEDTGHCHDTSLLQTDLPKHTTPGLFTWLNHAAKRASKVQVWSLMRTKLENIFCTARWNFLPS